jgi:hypothetical protein
MCFIGASFSRGLFCLDGTRTVVCALLTYDFTCEHTSPYPGAPLFTKQSLRLVLPPRGLGMGGGHADLATALRDTLALFAVSLVCDV